MTANSNYFRSLTALSTGSSYPPSLTTTSTSFSSYSSPSPSPPPFASSPTITRFPGLCRALDLEEDGPITEIYICDDLAAEEETIAAAESVGGIRGKVSNTFKAIHRAAQSITGKTLKEYERIAREYVQWLQTSDRVPAYITAASDWAENPHEDTPLYIVLFIGERCDSICFDTNTEKPPSVLRLSFATAQKLRAGITHFYGIEHNLGNLVWYKDACSNAWVGNPSISPLVSRYMTGLSHRKAQAGEAPTSARAITPEVMKRLYLQNRRDYAMLSSDKQEYLTSRLLQAVYTIAFICLLRIDEVLRIQMQDLTWHLDGSIELRLPFRKTKQNGDVPPFVLWPLPQNEAHLCPYRALCEWLAASKIRSGCLFQKLVRHGWRLKPDGEKENMTAEVFLELFRLNLLSIGMDYITPAFEASEDDDGKKWMSDRNSGLIKRRVVMDGYLRMTPNMHSLGRRSQKGLATLGGGGALPFMIETLEAMQTNTPRHQALIKETNLRASLPVSPHYAQLLAQLATQRGFYGHLLNLNCPLRGGPEQTQALVSWIVLLCVELRAVVGEHVHVSCMFNLPFFLPADSFFTNYTWRPTGPTDSVSFCLSRDLVPVQSERLRDIYVGVDVWGRGQHGDGGLVCFRALEHISPRGLGLSTVLFGQWWARERLLWAGPTDASVPFALPEALSRKGEPECPHGDFKPVGECFGEGLPLYPAVLPLHTTFFPGGSEAWSVEGRKVSGGVRMSWMDIDNQTSLGDVWPQPRVAWEDVDKGTEGLPVATANMLMEDVWNGGSALKLELAFPLSEVAEVADAAYQCVWVPVQALRLSVGYAYEVVAAYKVIGEFDSSSEDRPITAGVARAGDTYAEGEHRGDVRSDDVSATDHRQTLSLNVRNFPPTIKLPVSPKETFCSTGSA
ncbi:hypothetical protein EV714DRAFT_276702 [Schizophyllum commune]